ncbi:MAG: hypothetical protein HDT29_04595 [Clostridiales bacterium]|nr:hypothetical protein [Clostridiales bacterium]
MTQSQLTDIIKTADKKTITKRLKELGYIYCNEERHLGKVGIIELTQSVISETEDFADRKRKYLFNGRICLKVKGYENYEFVYVNVYKIKQSTDIFDNEEMAIQTEMLIWAKEIKNERL